MKAAFHPVYEKLISTEYCRLTESISRRFRVRPMLSALVEREGLGFRLANIGELDQKAEVPLIPKLGVKSWRDSGSLGVIYDGVNIRRSVEVLLAHPTKSQLLASKAWFNTDSPLSLYLLPYEDYSEVTEARFLVSHRDCQRSSVCIRGEVTRALLSALRDMFEVAREVATELPERSHVIDLGYFPDGQIALVDVNPGLTPLDIAHLKSEN